MKLPTVFEVRTPQAQAAAASKALTPEVMAPLPIEGRTHEPEIKSRTIALGLSDELGAFMMAGGLSGHSPSAALRLYEQSTTVTVPINWIGELFAMLEPVIVTDGRVETSHPLLDDLRMPSPYYSRVELFEKIAKDFLITGETGMVALGGVNRPPIELQPITPNAYQPNDAAGVPRSYTVTDQVLPGEYVGERDGRRVRFMQGGMLEFGVVKNYSTRNHGLLRGQSPLLAAAKEVRQHVMAGEHNVSLLEKGGRVSLVFHFARDMDQRVYEQTRKRIREAYGGSSKAGEIAVVTGQDLDVKELGLNPKEMDYKNLSEVARAAVLLQYRLPLALAFLDASTLDNYKIGKLSLYDDAVLPLAKRLFGWLSRFLMPRYGLDPARSMLAPNPEEIPALVERRLGELKTRKELNVETTDELRAQMGYDPYTGLREGAPGSAILETAAKAPLDQLVEEPEPIPPQLMDEDGNPLPPTPDDEDDEEETDE